MRSPRKATLNAVLVRAPLQFLSGRWSPNAGGRMKRILACGLLTAALAGCVSTPFKGVPAATLKDDQLIAELSSVYQQLGISTASLYQIQRMMPTPDIRVTANSFTSVYLNTQVFGDTAFTTGTARTTTTYSTYDANDVNRSMNQIAQSIQMARINTLSGRQFELESEARRRVEARRQQELALASALQNFFAWHPSLRSETDLLQTILPWEEGTSYQDTLERLGSEAETVLAGRAAGTTAGRWYGTLQVPTASRSNPQTIRVRATCRVSDLGPTCDVQSAAGASYVIAGMVSESGAFVGRLTSDLLNRDLLGSVSPSLIRVSFQEAGVLTLSR